jgi:hypothetical protein
MRLSTRRTLSPSSRVPSRLSWPPLRAAARSVSGSVSGTVVDQTRQFLHRATVTPATRQRAVTGDGLRTRQLRWEIYNVFNNTQFATVDAVARFDAVGNHVNTRCGRGITTRGPGDADPKASAERR